MSAGRAERAVNRIARQILEDTRGAGNLVLFGVDDRGHALAALLASGLEEILGKKIPFHKLSIKKETRGRPVTGVDITGSFVILIDDVIFSGKTMYRAFKQVMKLGDPEQVRLAVLIDRGHRIYPVQAQYVGLVCPTKPAEHVHCAFMDEKPSGVWLNVKLL